MINDIKKIILIVAFVTGVIGFNTIKTKTENQISKCMNALSKNSQGNIAFKY